MIAPPPVTLTRRGYELNGRVYPRVSTICALLAKPGLAYWRGKVGNTAADAHTQLSTDFGTRLHAALEAWARAPYASTWERDLPADLAPHAARFVEWWEGHVRAVLGAEHLLVSRRYGYAGTADLLVTLRDGATALVDYKSSKPYPADAPQPDAGWRLQTAAYAVAAAEQDGLPVDVRLVLQLPREQPGVLLVHRFDAPAAGADFTIFCGLLAAYRWQQNVRRGL